MQVDICQQGRADCALWDAKFRSLKKTMLHHSCFEETFDEFEKSLVCNAFCQAIHQDIMLHIIKCTLDIPFNDPEVFTLIVDVAIEGGDTIHCLASWPEAIGAIKEVALPDRF